MTTYICKCGRRVKKSTDASTTGNRLSGYAPGHECWGCPYAMPYGDFQWDESARTVSRETRGYECRMSKTLTYASEFAGSIKDKCTCRVHSLDFDFLSQVSAWIKDTYPDREIFGSFSKDIRASDYGSDGRYCLTITCAQNLKGVAAKRELFGQFFNPDGSRKDMIPQQEMEKILADIKKAKEILSCAPAQNADAAVTTAENAVPTATAATPTISESGADASASTPATSLQNCESAPAASAGDSSVSTAGAMQDKPLTFIREDKCPAFDYSGLTDQAVEDLHFAEDEYRHGKQMAERGLVHMGNAIAAAHDALCGVVQLLDNSKHGNRGDDSFRAWCCSIGITKSTAYNLLQVSALMDGSSPRQRAILEALPPTLLYAVAKPSAPQELVEKVKNGEVTTNKAYQDLLKENQQLRTERDKARADQLSTAKDCNRLGLKVSQEKDRADKAEAREEEAWKLQSKAETRAQEAEKQLEGSRQMAEAAKLRGDKLKAENDALKKQPITAVVDEEEVERRANQRAHDIAEDLAAEMTADLRAQLEQAASGSEQDAHSSYDNVLLADRSFQNIGKMVVPSLRRLPPEQREQLTNMLVHTLGQIQGEVSRCLQPSRPLRPKTSSASRPLRSPPPPPGSPSWAATTIRARPACWMPLPGRWAATASAPMPHSGTGPWLPPISRSPFPMA